MRTNCAQAGAQNLVIGSDTIHLLNLTDIKSTAAASTLTVREYVLPDPYKVAVGKTLFDLLVYLP